MADALEFDDFRRRVALNRLAHMRGVELTHKGLAEMAAKYTLAQINQMIHVDQLAKLCEVEKGA